MNLNAYLSLCIHKYRYIITTPLGKSELYTILYYRAILYLYYYRYEHAHTAYHTHTNHILHYTSYTYIPIQGGASIRG